MNFIHAIESKQAVSMIIVKNKHEGGGCNCGCVPPILEWEEALLPTTPKKPNGSFLQRHPSKKATGKTYDQGSSSSEEQEWDEVSSSDCGFASPKESDDDDGMTDLIKQTNHVEILSDSNDSSLGGFDSDTENQNPNKRKTKRPQANKSAGMTKAAFQRNREALMKEAFLEFNQDAFSGKLSTVDVVWSKTLRTTAGLTLLKTILKDTTPGAPLDRLASIELSTKVLDDQERLRSTLLHEMVHAAAWIVDGVSEPPHGSCFKKWAKVAMRNIPDAVVTTTHDYDIQYKHAWVSLQSSAS
jgi:hypothetical protein